MLARENRSLDVGVHLVLVGSDGFPPTVLQLIQQIARRRIRVYDELAAQVRKVQSAGIRPTHLDTHKHTHLLPPVLKAVARIASEFQIPWVRRPFDLPLHGGGRALATAGSKQDSWIRARAISSRSDQPRMPHHGSFCGLSTHRAL